MEDVSDQVSGLGEAERAFRVTQGKHEGEICKVRVTKVSDGDGPEPGVGESRFLKLKTQAFHIDEDGETILRDGVPVQTTKKARSIQVDALAEGTLSVPNELAEATREAVERFKRHLSALEAWDSIPENVS